MLVSVCLRQQDTPGFQSRDREMAPPVLAVPGTLPWEFWAGAAPQPVEGDTAPPLPLGLCRTQPSAQTLPRTPKEPLERSRVGFCTIPSADNAPSRERVGRSLSPEQIQLMNTGENQGGWQQILDEEGREGC